MKSRDFLQSDRLCRDNPAVGPPGRPVTLPAVLDRSRSFEHYAVRSRTSVQSSHRDKRLKVSAQATVTTKQSQIPRTLRNNLVTLEADNPAVPGGKTAVYLLGVSHVSEVRQACLLGRQAKNNTTRGSEP